jgi:formylglycine-generating enzyme required for sulfatase activity
VGHPTALKAIAVAALACGCSEVPFGEVLVVADTEVSVPRLAGHLRVDLFTVDAAGKTGVWYDSRDVPTLARDQWPLSFSLVTDGASEKRVRVRLRAYPDGAVRDYHGEQYAGDPPFVEPYVAGSQAQLCTLEPQLAAGDELTVRMGEDQIDDRANSPDCAYRIAGGTAAVQVTLPKDDTYRFEVVRSVPDGRTGDVGGDTVLFLRSQCQVRESQIACNDNYDEAHGNYLSRIIAPVNAGTYYLLVGANIPSPADVTLRWTAASDWDKVTPAPPPPAPGLPVPSLTIDGDDATPLNEPEPGATIDRIFDVRVQPGTRRTARILLAGECDGTQADLLGGTTCVDTAGVRVPVPAATLADGIDRGGRTLAGTWAAEQPAPCTATPRDRSVAPDGTPLFDEEVCVPGGAFVLGVSGVIGYGERDAVPQQVAVVPPFLIGAHEITVGRYRQAVRDGFVSPDPPIDVTPRVNDGPIDYAPSNANGLCTYNGDDSGPAPGVDRERYPLNCVTWRTARALCQFLGGDLVSGVQWEYAAKSAGRPFDTNYPWGDSDPVCDSAVYERVPTTEQCSKTIGPAPVDQEPQDDNDVTPLGVHAMAGGMSEWALDAFRPYADACWHQHHLRGVGCSEVNAPRRLTLGGGWRVQGVDLRIGRIIGQTTGLDTIDDGIRCVRTGVAP